MYPRPASESEKKCCRSLNFSFDLSMFSVCHAMYIIRYHMAEELQLKSEVYTIRQM